MLTKIGSANIYPYRGMQSVWEDKMKELKTTADLGYKAFMRLSDFTSEEEIAYTFKEQNVCICLIGSKVYYKSE
jgi:hypothetical protein